MKSCDYSFFDQSLSTTRLLKSYTCPYYILDAVPELFGDRRPIKAPVLIYRDENPKTLDGTYIFETASYASSPGHGLARVQELVGHPLPSDFLAFYQRYEKALIVTRTYPIHMWHEDKIIEGIFDYWAYPDRPFRILRFGDQYDRQATQFGLWLEEPGTMKWRVVSTQIGSNYLDDTLMDPGQIIGQSFYEWLKDWVDRDGLPDGFMNLGPEGGFIDPLTEEDMARLAARPGLGAQLRFS